MRFQALGTDVTDKVVIITGGKPGHRAAPARHSRRCRAPAFRVVVGYAHQPGRRAEEVVAKIGASNGKAIAGEVRCPRMRRTFLALFAASDEFGTPRRARQQCRHRRQERRGASTRCRPSASSK